MNETGFYGQQFILNHIRTAAAAVHKGNGGIICLSGEQGFGKTTLLKYLELEFREKNYIVTYTAAQAPIGSLKIGNLQPLAPFSKTIELLMEYKSGTAQQRFAKNIGMTLLASIPLTGEVFYAIKEIGRDWRQFKKEQSSDSTRKVSSATADTYDAFRATADKAPLIIFLDDMQWADVQSVELLNLFAENISKIPILIVTTFRKSFVETHSLPIASFINNPILKGKVNVLDLEEFKAKEIKECAHDYFDNYKQNPEFEKWIMERSGGNPGAAIEYMRFLKQRNPFHPDGSLSVDLKGNEFLPASLHALFSQTLSTLSDEDKNILAVCSAEGNEFTIGLVAKLLNLDVLSTIKKLKAIQNKSGIIRSQGAHSIYGEKVTIYKFTQAFYQSFFEKTLEFEEYTALHSQIAAFLKDKFENTQSDELKEKIAPYLAAHSAAAGDNETAESMLLVSAESAKKYGSVEFAKEAYSEYIFIQKDEISDDAHEERNESFRNIIDQTAKVRKNVDNQVDGEEGSVPVETRRTVDFDFEKDFEMITKEYVSGNINFVEAKIDEIFANYAATLNSVEKAKLLCLKAKKLIDSQDYNSAENNLVMVKDLLSNEYDEVVNCLLCNLSAVVESNKGNFVQSRHYLNLAAEAAVGLGAELRLLTAANIALIMKENSYPGSQKYFDSARKLALDLNFKEFQKDLENSFNSIN